MRGLDLLERESRNVVVCTANGIRQVHKRLMHDDQHLIVDP